MGRGWRWGEAGGDAAGTRGARKGRDGEGAQRSRWRGKGAAGVAGAEGAGGEGARAEGRGAAGYPEDWASPHRRGSPRVPAAGAGSALSPAAIEEPPPPPSAAPATSVGPRLPARGQSAAAMLGRRPTAQSQAAFDGPGHVSE